MDQSGWIIAAIAVAVFYLPVMAGLMVLAMWWLFTPGRVNWAGPRRSDPFALGYRGDPMTALGLPYETVTYRTDLGDERAWLVPGPGRRVWAIYVHGVGGLRENGFRQLSVLAEAGIPTLMISYRHDAGTPRAARPFYSFGLTEWADLEAAVRFARERGAERIVLVAESMGGAIAGQFLMRSGEARHVAGLALEAPALDLRVIVLSWTRFLPFGDAIRRLGYAFARRILPADLETAVCFEAVRDFAGPVFLVHGTADPLVPVTMSRRLSAERTGSTISIETNAGHLTSWQADRQRYRDGFRQLLAALTDDQSAR